MADTKGEKGWVIFRDKAPLSKVISYSSLVEALSFVEELSDVL